MCVDGWQPVMYLGIYSFRYLSCLPLFDVLSHLQHINELIDLDVRVTTGNVLKDHNKMNAVLGHDSALVTLYWAGDNLGWGQPGLRR